MNALAATHDVIHERMDERQRYRLVLRAWEAVNQPQGMDRVLDAVAEMLEPHVAFDGILIPVFRGARRGLFARRVGGVSCAHPEQTPGLMSSEPAPGATGMAARPLRPYGPSLLGDRMQAGLPWHSPDLLGEPAWYRHEFRMAAMGVRSYCSIPMLVDGELIGLIAFIRLRQKPFSTEAMELLHEVSLPIALAVAKALAWEETHELRRQLEDENVSLPTAVETAPPCSDEIAGNSPALQRVLEAAEQVARTDATVLITGETGTGKELVARRVHQRSLRAQQPLVAVHCAAIPQTLLASELFGHERGAFTGASARRQGRFEQAHRGTLFLDEVGEMSLETQVMLLRVLQERSFERLGGSETLRADVRLIAATNRDLTREIGEGRFRSDLFYRLNVFPIRVPPLRERREDIAALASRFAAHHAALLGRRIERIDRKSLRLLESCDWPGNVRELENVIERAVILARGSTLRVEREMIEGAGATGSVDEELKQRQRHAIESALQATCGRVWGPQGAARRLGLAPSTLDLRIKRLGIDKLKFRRS